MIGSSHETPAVRGGDAPSAESGAFAVAETVPGSIAVGSCTAITPRGSGALFDSG